MKLLLFGGLVIQFMVAVIFNKSAPGKTKLMEKTECQEPAQLVNRKWEMQEIRFLQDNKDYFYKKGDYSSNSNFDNDYVIFYCDGSGLYHQTDGTEYELNWHLKGNVEDAIEYTIKNFRDQNDLVVNWEHLQLSNNNIQYTEYYTHENGIHSLGSAIRMFKGSTYITSR